MNLDMWCFNMELLKNNWFRFGLFFTIIVAILMFLQFVVFVEEKTNNIYRNFYLQEENSLDLVCIGSSTLMRDYNPCQAWNEFKITSYNVCDSPIHPEVICIAIDEVLRVQSPKVVYIDINSLTYFTRFEMDEFVKRYLNSMPGGELRNNLISKYKYDDMATVTYELFKNHNAYRNSEYIGNYEGVEFLKGYYPYLDTRKMTAYQLDESKVLDIDSRAVDYIYRILDICKKHIDTNFVFGKLPRILNDETAKETYQLRSIVPIIQEYGYPYIEWERYIDDMELNPETDASDIHHLNIYGSQKFTNYFINYLDNEYSITNTNHSQQVIDDYNNAYQRFSEIYKEYL